jgi:hypothetical protein
LPVVLAVSAGMGCSVLTWKEFGERGVAIWWPWLDRLLALHLHVLLESYHCQVEPTTP